MVNRYTLGGAIFSIFLLAIFGIQGAFSWLSQSPRDNSDRIAAVDSGTNDSLNNRSTSTGNSRINVDSSELSSTRDGRTSELATFSPLEEAGTYIQRQKRVERDTVVAQTQVDVIPVASANNTAVPVQNDTRVTQPSTSTAQSPSTSRPAAASSSTEAVPALW